MAWHQHASAAALCLVRQTQRNGGVAILLAAFNVSESGGVAVGGGERNENRAKAHQQLIV